MLKLEQVSKTFYPNTGNEKRAMDHLDLLIHTGEFVTVIGSNGAGKSTLFNLIAGSILPDSGRILLDNEDITFCRNINGQIGLEGSFRTRCEELLLP